MAENDAATEARMTRLRKKIAADVREEYAAGIERLKNRTDYLPAYDYFLDLLARSLNPAGLRQSVGRELVVHLCNQAPYELFDAFGVHPLRQSSGCHAVQRLCAHDCPALMCPMMKSTVGMMRLDESPAAATAGRVVPTTCDWVVGFAQSRPSSQDAGLMLELPHVREGEKARKRWLEEVYGLAAYLEKLTGKKLKSVPLTASVKRFNRAWQELGDLVALRRRRHVAGVWFSAVAGSFMLDAIDTWSDRLRQLVKILSTVSPAPRTPGVFLAGSPVIFPNFKLLHLINEARMDVRADDLCVSERILPGALCHEDTSVHGLMRALAERYHQGCTCPTFADNQRRINSIFNTLAHHDLHGVIYHVLKGCHPCDMESYGIEKQLKQNGHRFLRIETDYTDADSRNILTRLEAFGEL